MFNYWSTTDPIEAALAPRILKQLLHLFTYPQVQPTLCLRVALVINAYDTNPIINAFVTVAIASQYLW